MRTIIKVRILVAITIVSIIVAIANYRNYFDLFYWEDYMYPLVIAVGLLLLTLIIAFLVLSLIKGHFVKPLFWKYFFWTNIIVLIWGHYWLFSNYSDKINAYKRENITHNETYKKFYGDDRDSIVTLAVNAIEQKQKEIGDYRIYGMRVIEKDTVLNDKLLKFYDVHQFYHLKYEDFKDAYVARHLIVDNKLYEIFDKPYFADSTGITEKYMYDSLIKKTMTNRSFDEIRAAGEDLITDVVKLHE